MSALTEAAARTRADEQSRGAVSSARATTAARSRRPFSAPVMVGRAAELRRLREAVAAPPTAVLVEGDAGLGKTRLVAELVDLAPPGTLVLVARAQPVREPFPLGPFVDALRGLRGVLPALRLSPLAGALRPLLPELSAELPPELAPLDDSAGERHRVFRAVAELLAGAGPVWCVLEDLHWADSGTWDLLSFLACDPPAGTSLVATCRSAELLPVPGASLARHLPTAAFATRIRLSVLELHDVRRLVAAILDVDDVSEEFSAYLHERTGGNPFAIEEVLRLLSDRRDLVQKGGQWGRRALDKMQVPAAVRDLTLERLALLQPDARALVRAAAVLNAPSSASLLAHVADLPDERADRALFAALTSALVQQAGDGYALCHPLAREAVHEAMGPADRERAHLRAGRALEQHEPSAVTRLAHHFREGGGTRAWVRYAEAAADLATSLGDDAGAYTFLEPALDAPGVDGATRARMAVKLGEAAVHGLAHADTIAVLQRILATDALPAATRGELRLSLARLLRQAGDATASYREDACAAAELRRRPALAVRAMLNLAAPWVLEGAASDHVAWLERAVRVAGKVQEPISTTALLLDRAAILLYLGDPEGWRVTRDIPAFAISLEGWRELARGHANLATAALHLGHYERARAFLAESARICDDLGYERIRGPLTTIDVLIRWATGTWEGLEALAARAADAAEGIPHAAVEAQLVVGTLQLARGAVDDGEALLAAVQETAARAGSVPVYAAAAAARSELRLASGAYTDAAAIACAAVDVLARKQIWAWAGEVVAPAVAALLADGRGNDARRLAERLAKGLKGRDAPAARAALSLCRGRLAEHDGDHERAARLYSGAERAFRTLPRAYWALMASEGAGRCLAAARDPRGAVLLKSSAEGFTALGAARDAERVHQTLRDRVARPHRRGRKGYGDGLSPREREVARLVAAGRSNREIAAELYLSPRTVEHHVTNAMRKSGATSRTALAVLLVEEGADARAIDAGSAP